MVIAVSQAVAAAFSGSELTRLLARAQLDDPGSSITKWRRLHESLSSRQASTRSGSHVAAFVRVAAEPANFVGRQPQPEALVADLNQALAFAGIEVGEDSELRRVKAATTLTEAERRADKLRAELRRRRVNPDVLHFCQAELLVDDYFHAVFEAAKSLADKLRRLTGLQLDGVQLVDAAFELGTAGPYLVVNGLGSQTDRDEHQGLAFALRGLFKLFRNVPAHLPRMRIFPTSAPRQAQLRSRLHRSLHRQAAQHQLLQRALLTLTAATDFRMFGDRRTTSGVNGP